VIGDSSPALLYPEAGIRGDSVEKGAGAVRGSFGKTYCHWAVKFPFSTEWTCENSFRVEKGAPVAFGWHDGGWGG
jgi:hypothetical protein